MKRTYKNFLIFLILISGAKLLARNNNINSIKHNELAVSFAEKAAKDMAISQPLSFLENKGQILGYDGLSQPGVKFVFQQGNMQIFLLERGIAYQFTKTDYPEGFQDLIKDKSAKKNCNLIKDHAEQIDTIRWTVYGKIKAIIRTPSSTKNNLFFDYDATGNRIAKHIYTSANVWQSSTYYLRDAQGKAM